MQVEQEQLDFIIGHHLIHLLYVVVIIADCFLFISRKREDMVAEMRDIVKVVAPFTVMFIMEGCTIALTILAKTAITGGVSPFIFVLYTNAVGSLFLLPFSFLYHRGQRPQQSLFTFPLLLRIFFMGLTGIAISQNLAFLGLSYSSPIVVCATGLLLPTISFLLSIILRTTRLEWRSSCSQAKMIGTLISIAGFIVVELYKGPFTRPSPVSHHLQFIPKLFVFYSAPDRWILGGIMLATASLSISIWNIIQARTVKQYPVQVMKVASFYSLVGTIQCLVFSLIMERDLNAWKIQHKRDLLLIIVTGLFANIIRSNVHLACTRMKGPFYVPMFKPFGLLFATVFGTAFFTNNLHYGSVIGTAVVGTGYYALMWAQIKEEDLRKERDVEKVDDISDLKAPLLEEQEEESQV